jgi:hypothetical protein
MLSFPFYQSEAGLAGTEKGVMAGSEGMTSPCLRPAGVAVGTWAKGSGVSVGVMVGITGVGVAVGVGSRCSSSPTRGGLVATTKPMRLNSRIKKALPGIVTSCQYSDIPGTAGERLRYSSTELRVGAKNPG